VKTCEHCGFEPVQEDNCPLCGNAVLGLDETQASSLVEVSLPSRPTTGRDVVGQEYRAGHLYDGRYRIEAFLGRGGMGRVYRVLEEATGRTLALKILLRAVMDDEDSVERFRREIVLLAEIKHPAVPAVVDWGYCNGEYFFVCDFIEGQDLRSLTRARGPWPPIEAAGVVAQVAHALQAAHDKGIVHRDIKPHNIMLRPDGRAFLLDFGIARAYGHGMETLTASGMLVGTPEYMSPEQVDSHTIDLRSDIYSLGVVLFELLIGRPPFGGETPLNIAMKHKLEPPPSPRVERQDVPFWLDRVVLRCLAKDPCERYPSAARLALELTRPRSEQAARRRQLASGDFVVEDEGHASEWALVLATPQEKSGWGIGMALGFGGSFYLLAEIQRPTERAGTWEYRCLPWPTGAVLRKVVDYERDCAEQLGNRSSTLGAQIKGLFGRSKS
jgi:hypothetical protein